MGCRVGRAGAMFRALAIFGLLLLGACSPAAGSPPQLPQTVQTDTGAGQGDAALGAQLFAGEVQIDGFVACNTCHETRPDQPQRIGPNLDSVADRAGTRIAGVPADEYLRRSILVHDDYVVEGFAPGLAVSVVGQEFGELLESAQVEALVSYLLTLDAANAAHVAAAASASSEPSATNTLLPAVPRQTAPPLSTQPTTPVVAAIIAAESSTPTSLPPAATPTDVPATAITASATTLATTAFPATTAAATPSLAATTIPATPTFAATAEPSNTSAATAIPPTAVPPTIVPPTPVPATLPPAPVATPTAAPTTGSGTGEGLVDDPALAVYQNCITCHNQHASTVVLMPHIVFPTCNDCHRGAPARISCPSCHSTHSVETPHEDPNLPCTACHAQ